MCCSYTGDTSYYQQKQDQTRGTAETVQDSTMVVVLHSFPGCEPSSKLFFCFGSPNYLMYPVIFFFLIIIFKNHIKISA